MSLVVTVQSSSSVPRQHVAIAHDVCVALRLTAMAPVLLTFVSNRDENDAPLPQGQENAVPSRQLFRSIPSKTLPPRHIALAAAEFGQLCGAPSPASPVPLTPPSSVSPTPVPLTPPSSVSPTPGRSRSRPGGVARAALEAPAALRTVPHVLIGPFVLHSAGTVPVPTYAAHRDSQVNHILQTLLQLRGRCVPSDDPVAALPGTSSVLSTCSSSSGVAPLTVTDLCAARSAANKQQPGSVLLLGDRCRFWPSVVQSLLSSLVPPAAHPAAHSDANIAMAEVTQSFASQCRIGSAPTAPSSTSPPSCVPTALRTASPPSCVPTALRTVWNAVSTAVCECGRYRPGGSPHSMHQSTVLHVGGEAGSGRTTTVFGALDALRFEPLTLINRQQVSADPVCPVVSTFSCTLALQPSGDDNFPPLEDMLPLLSIALRGVSGEDAALPLPFARFESSSSPCSDGKTGASTFLNAPNTSCCASVKAPVLPFVEEFCPVVVLVVKADDDTELDLRACAQLSALVTDGIPGSSCAISRGRTPSPSLPLCVVLISSMLPKNLPSRLASLVTQSTAPLPCATPEDRLGLLRFVLQPSLALSDAEFEAVASLPTMPKAVAAAAGLSAADIGRALHMARVEACRISGISPAVALSPGSSESPSAEDSIADVKAIIDVLPVALRRTTPAVAAAFSVAIPNVSWDSIGGQDAAKAALREAVVDAQQYAAVFKAFGARPTSGILLYGPPGCGKTMMAKAVASSAAAHFLSVRGPELLSKWVGDSEKAIAKLFACARRVQPAVVFIDEIDSLCSARGSSGVATLDRVVAQILVEMDGIATSAGSPRIVVIAATNRPDVLDPALLRPGRFQARVFVAPPDGCARRGIIQRRLGGVAANSSVTDGVVDQLTVASEGFSGAELASALDAALLAALKRFVQSQAGTEECSGVDANAIGPVVDANLLLSAFAAVTPAIAASEIASFEALWR